MTLVASYISMSVRGVGMYLCVCMHTCMHICVRVPYMCKRVHRVCTCVITHTYTMYTLHS